LHLSGLQGLSLFQVLQHSLPTFIVVASILGLMVGSFLNVVIHRLPRMMERAWREQCAELNGDVAFAAGDSRYNLIVPHSACPSCGAQITALQNVPVLSYLFLRGRCANCHAPIGLRYPLVEAATGFLSGFLAWRFGFGFASICAIVFAWALIALTCIDFDTQLLPDDITLPLLWLGLLVNMQGVFTDLSSAVIGAVAGYLVLWTVYWLFKLATGKEGMGYGDFKLLAALGAWLGWQMLPLMILLSAGVGAVVGVGLIALTRHGRNVPIPFGPYLAIAGMIAMLWGQDLMRIYLSV
jgi:leader peptidase (prepilin peptidase)/N-methyltransferase